MQRISKWLSLEIPEHPSITTRAIYFFLSLAALVVVSGLTTGSILHTDNQLANIFQSGLLLVVLGSVLLEDKFTRPVDALVNSLTSIISLIAIYGTSAKLLWVALLIYSVLVFILSLTGLLTIEATNEDWKRVNKFSYFVSKKFGKAQVIFSMVFLFSVFSYYRQDETRLSVLVIFWAFYVGLLSLKVPQFVQGIFENRQRADSRNEVLGVVLRVDYPNIVKLELLPEKSWTSRKLAVVCLGDGKAQYIQPLYAQTQDRVIIGTGLILPPSQVTESKLPELTISLDKGYVYTTQVDDSTQIDKPLGFVLQESKVEKLLFETWQPEMLSLGLLVSCTLNGQVVYYQIANGSTKEEAFKSHEYGFQIVEAFQLGRVENGRFAKAVWLPQMNTPIYRTHKVEGYAQSEGSQELGKIPSTQIPVYSSISEMREFHTAILGVTGVGKTCLAHTLIQDAIANGIKVICIDPTGDYKKSNKLKEIGARAFSFPDDVNVNVLVENNRQRNEVARTYTILEITDAVHAIETGAFGAPLELENYNRIRKATIEALEPEIERFFIVDENQLGIYTLPADASLLSAIALTDIFLSAIFAYKRTPDGMNTPSVLVVLEEAHLLVPETFTLGLSDKPSKELVARISQVAFQGRKFGVGLLLISQRTATVSKNVLSQCNSIISFMSYDGTGLDLMRGFYGEQAFEIPNLASRQALAFGKGIKTQRPIIVQIPEYDPCKPENFQNIDDLPPLLEITELENEDFQDTYNTYDDSYPPSEVDDIPF